MGGDWSTIASMILRILHVSSSAEVDIVPIKQKHFLHVYIKSALTFKRFQYRSEYNSLIMLSFRTI